MKTPQRWSISPDWRHLVMSQDIVTPCHDVTSRHTVMTYHDTPGFCIRSTKSENPGNNVFWPCDLDLWSMTLTIKRGRDFIKVNPHTNFWVCTPNSSAMKVLTNWQTERRKHGTYSITSTTDAGGKYVLILQKGILLPYWYRPRS